MFCTAEVAGDPFLAALPGASEGAPRLGGVILKRKLGEGGMGRVYLGLHTRLDIPVAVKVMKEAGPERLWRLALEARITARLDHPNLVRIFDFDTAPSEDGVFSHAYIVMEHVEGRTALEMLVASIEERHAPLDVASALEIGHACALALAAAHERGFIHRDVKPSNILVRARDGLVKLADLGLAHVWAGPGGQAGAPPTPPSAVAAGLAEGTRGFVSPEVLTGAPVGPKADIYGLGVTLYVLATGFMPHGTVDDGYATRQLDSPAPDPRIHLPALDARVAELLLSCLDRDPAQRPADAAALAEALQRLRAPSGAPGRATALVPRARSEVPAPARPVVLCVDDDDMALDLMRHVLERSGFEPVTYGEARRALEDASSLDPDVAIVDLAMPDMDGLELFRRMRERPDLRDVPVLMFSAQSAEDRIAEALRLGVTDYLVKPVDAREVPIRVRLLAHLRAVARERARIERAYRSRKQGVAGTAAIPPTVPIHGPVLDGRPTLPQPGAPASVPDTLRVPGPDELPGCLDSTAPRPAPELEPARREVLVVDDDEDARALLRLALAKAGHAVSEAADGHEALARIARRRPALLVLDMVMPGLGGVDVCRRVRSDPANASLPILIVTARMDPDAIRDALEAGATDYLIKPVDPNQLACRVLAALEVERASEAVHELGEALATLF